MKLHWLERAPREWSPRKLRDVAWIQNSNVDKKTEKDEIPVRLCNYTDIYYNDQITNDLDFTSATVTSSEFRKFRLQPGDVIFTKDSESWNDIAVPAVVGEDIDEVVCGYHLTMLRPYNETNGRFLFRCLQANGIREQFWIGATGVTRYGLGQDVIKNVVIPFPSYATQLKIADFLDRKTAAIDAVIEKKERLIEVLERKRSSLIHRAVTKGLDPDVPMKNSGVPWIGEIPEHWEVARLKYVCRVESGHTPSRSNPDYWIEEECTIPWVSLNDTSTLAQKDYISETRFKISPRGMANSSAHLIEPGAVVFTRDATIGLSAITTMAATVSQHLIAWVCKSSLYNKYLLRVTDAMTQELDSLTFGATIKTIGMADIRNLSGPIPPLEEQNEIVNWLDEQLHSITTLRSTLQSQINKLREYRQSLITAAVTGQLEVPGPQSAID